MDRSSQSLIDTNQPSTPSANRSISSKETNNKNVPKSGRRRFDDILDYIKDKYGLPDKTWTDKQYRILDADVSKTFSILPYFEQESGNNEMEDIDPEKKFEFVTPEIWDWVMAKYGEGNLDWDDEKISIVVDDVQRTFYDKTEPKKDSPDCTTKEIFLECPMKETNVPESSTKKATKDATRNMGATNIVDQQTEVIEISSGTASTIESSSTEEDKDDSDDWEISNSSGELVMCVNDSTNKSVIDEDEDDMDKEETDDDDDSDDELWTPKTVAKGATSSSSPSTKKKSCQR